MGGPEMAPQPPPRSSRPGEAVARLDPPRSSRPGEAVARLDPPCSSRPGEAVTRLDRLPAGARAPAVPPARLRAAPDSALPDRPRRSPRTNPGTGRTPGDARRPGRSRQGRSARSPAPAIARAEWPTRRRGRPPARTPGSADRPTRRAILTAPSAATRRARHEAAPAAAHADASRDTADP